MKIPQTPKRVLLVRNDRLGDLVLATPALEMLDKSLPSASISILVSPANLDIVNCNPHVHEVLLDDYGKGMRGVKALTADLKRRRFDAAILAVPSLRVALALFLSRIPVRIGPAPHVYCYLLLNKIIAQHRSRVEKHEAEYVMDLLKPLGLEPETGLRPSLHVEDANRERMRNKLQTLGITGKSGKLVVVQPGMGGSALNWPLEHWAALINKLGSSPGHCCVVTGSKSDKPYLQKILRQVESDRFIPMIGQTTVGLLAALLERADIFVGPSTGPMHMASCFDTFIIALFSPVRVQSKKRWGPYNLKKGIVFSPSIECPGVYACIGEKCKHFYCMDQVLPEQIFEEIIKQHD